MKKPRRATLVLWFVVVAVVAVLNPLVPPVWEWVTTTTIPIPLNAYILPAGLDPWGQHYPWGQNNALLYGTGSRHLIRGWETVKRGRGNRHGPLVAYYVENGHKAIEGVYENGNLVWVTKWKLDGRVMSLAQDVRNVGGSTGQVEIKATHPWWWGVQDQTEPTDPQWIAEHGKQ